MSSILDIIGSTILVGILAITVFNINNNFSMSTFKAMETYQVQSQGVQLGRILEHDLYKIGYRVDTLKVLKADTANIIFRADIDDDGAPDSVEYVLGTSVVSSVNSRDKQLNRIVNGSSLFISYNVTRFYLSYYDSASTLIATPISTEANLRRIRAVKVVLILESPDPVEYIDRGTQTSTSTYQTSTSKVDSLYTGAYYEKLLHPRNMTFIK